MTPDQRSRLRAAIQGIETATESLTDIIADIVCEAVRTAQEATQGTEAADALPTPPPASQATPEAGKWQLTESIVKWVQSIADQTGKPMIIVPGSKGMDYSGRIDYFVIAEDADADERARGILINPTVAPENRP